MKRVALILAFLMCLGSFAYAEVGFGLGAQAGASFSSFPDPVGDYYGTGFGGGVFGDVNVMEYFSARLSFDYFTFSSDEDKIIAQYVANNQGTQASDFTLEGLNVGVFSIYTSGIGKIPTGSNITPYGVIGLGMNFLGEAKGRREVSKHTTGDKKHKDFHSRG